jgi:transcription antitermination factor NusA-like protein
MDVSELKTLICIFCAKSGVLCPKCQEKLDKGEITQDDVEISRWFIEYENKNPQLKDCTLHKVVRVPEMLVVMISCIGKISRAFLMKISKQISEEKKMNVRIVEKTSSIKKLLEQILAPARVMGINTIWLPDGSWESIIRIPKVDRKKMPIDANSAEEIMKKLTGEIIHIVFE